ncbi:MAG: hypothetical protein HY817_04535 [Candidatus Abawacabacteria bacterium]|nr:hypothetical protein [Candidatus Abawacabacteria bacterium]
MPAPSTLLEESEDAHDTAPKTKVYIPGTVNFAITTLARSAAIMEAQTLREMAMAERHRRKQREVTMEFPHHRVTKLTAQLASELRTVISGLLQSPQRWKHRRPTEITPRVSTVLNSVEEIIRDLIQKLEQHITAQREMVRGLLQDTLAYHLSIVPQHASLYSRHPRLHRSIRDQPLLGHKEHQALLERMGLKK